MAILQLILAMIIWGTLGLFVLKSGLGSIDIAFFRCFIGALILAVYCGCQGLFSKQYLKRETSIPIVCGGIFIVLNWILLFESFKYASITLGNVSYYMQPVFLLFLARFFFNETISIVKGFFILVTITGVLLTIDLSSQTIAINYSELYGVLCALLAGFFYSLATIIAKKIKNVSAPMMTFMQLLVGMIILLPLASLNTLHFSWNILFYIVILGVIHTVLAFILYYQAVTQLPTDKIAVISYVDPIAAIYTDVLFFNRILNATQIIGIILTFLGSYFVINPGSIGKCYRKFAQLGAKK